MPWAPIREIAPSRGRTAQLHKSTEWGQQTQIGPAIPSSVALSGDSTAKGPAHAPCAKRLCKGIMQCMAVTTPPAHLESDPVRMLAHPLRSRLVASLRQLGPSTATDLARELSTNSGATSYHLRKLAEVGLVVDTGAGDARRRVWTAAERPAAQVRSDVGDEDTATAINWLERDWLRHFTEKFDRWLDVRTGWPRRWRDAAGMNDHVVVVTAEQLSAMHDELREVLERYRRAGQGNPGAKRIAAYLTFYPVDMEHPARR